MSKIFFRSLFFDPDIDFNIYGGVKLHDKVHSQVLKIQGVHKCDAKIQTLKRLRFNSIR
jgi:hypothetical protein